MLIIMNTKKILIKNVQALQRHRPELGSGPSIAARCRKHGFKIAARTINYMLDDASERQPTLDSIDAMAGAFGLPVWMLLHPELDAANKSVIDPPSERATYIAKRIDAKKLTNDEIDLLLKLIGDSIPDEQLEHLRAPQAAEPDTKVNEYQKSVKLKKTSASSITRRK